MTEHRDQRFRQHAVVVLGIAAAVYAVVEVNLAVLHPLTGLALFAMPMIAMVFLQQPLLQRLEDVRWLRWVDTALAAIAMACFAYIAVEAEALGQRVGEFTATDHAVGFVGLLLVIEATRRATGPALPILTVLFVLYALRGPALPDWLLPHRGETFETLIDHAWLQTSSEGVFGIALSVMFRYVFPFVLFGGFLEATGATQFIVQFADRMFGRTPGGAAKIAVFGSGLLGSLSGSAVANTVTSGAFTIPMMKSSGFKPHEAAGIEAAASSGGALLPPVMGAGAYMMLEVIPDQRIELIDILRAALIPGLLYYLSIFLLVHFHAHRIRARAAAQEKHEARPLPVFEGVMFVGSLAVLVTLLLMRYSPYRAATYTIGLMLVGMLFHPRLTVTRPQRVALAAVAAALLWPTYLVLPYLPHVTPTWPTAVLLVIALTLLGALAIPGWRPVIRDALVRAAQTSATLVAAVCCVGIIIAIVFISGAGTALPAAVTPLAEKSLLGALLLIMACSIVLGMGLPSAVVYLLLAILLGDVLENLGVPILAAHLFVFYFGMMSMVTPPVALAAYAAASIAGAGIMRSSFAAFRFALVGFTLPFMFVYRPELLLITTEHTGVAGLVYAIGIALVGIVSLAAALAGFLFRMLTRLERALAFAAGALALLPDPGWVLGDARVSMMKAVGVAPTVIDLLGIGLLVAVVALNRRPQPGATDPAAASA